MPKVLCVCYYFPPIGGGGVQRSAKFVKYLPDFGWKPYVISTDRTIDVEGRDDSILSDLPDGVRVWRVATPHPAPVTRLDRLGGRLRSFSCQSDFDAGAEALAKMAPERAVQAQAPNKLFRALRRLKQVVAWPLRPIEDPPIDRYLYWSLRIAPIALGLIRRHGLDVIYTTSTPWSAHLAGLLLHKFSGRPWVADFRDPWTGNQLAYHRKGWRRIVDGWVERESLGEADAVIAVSQPQMAGLQALAPTHSRADFRTITNGYDPDDFSMDQLQFEDTYPRRVVHAGVVYAGTIDPLLAALEKLATVGDFGQRLQVTLVGHFHPPTLDLINASPARAMIQLGAPISHGEVVKLIQQSAANLLLMGDDPYWSTVFSGKVFELIACGRPILAIAPEGGAADLVRQSGTGCVCAPGDVETLATRLRAIAENYPQFVHDHYAPRYEVIRRFDRRKLTAQLAGVFDAVVGQ